MFFVCFPVNFVNYIYEVIYIEKNIIKLHNSFIEIQKLGWIEARGNGYGAAGIMLEQLLGLSNNKFEIPDFYGIELKTKRKNSKSFISLFCAAPDGEYLFSTKDIVNKFGWPDKKYKSSNILFCDVYGNKKMDVGIKYMMRLDVDYNHKRIYLCVYSKYTGALLSRSDFYWSFELLEEKLIRKLKLLAIVYIKNKKIKNKDFFYYEEINFFKLISFERFCELIDLGVIKISFKVGVRMLNGNIKTVDHGTSFSISESDVEKLFILL